MAIDEADAWLAGESIADDGFSNRVMRRVEAYRRRRRMVLSGAALAGVAIALPSLPALATLAGLANAWTVQSLSQYSLPAITTPMVFASVAFGAWLMSLLLEAD